MSQRLPTSHIRHSCSAIGRVPCNFELFRKIVVWPSSPFTMRLQQFDDSSPLFQILYVVARRENTLRRNDDGTPLNRTTCNATDDLNSRSKACLSAEQLLHTADCGCVFQEKQLGKMQDLYGETCVMSASTRTIYVVLQSYLRLSD